MAQSKYFSKIIAVMMILVSFVSMFSISSSAATSGGERSATITVTTKANYWYPGASSITLQQSKQTATYGQFSTSKTKTTTGYFGYYNITVYNITKNTTKSDNWDGGKTKKIKLDPNCTYKITVSYNSTATVTYNVKSPDWRYCNYRGITSPSWKVCSTHKVTSYK